MFDRETLRRKAFRDLRGMLSQRFTQTAYEFDANQCRSSVPTPKAELFILGSLFISGQ
jgi:hypothetical protein